MEERGRRERGGSEGNVEREREGGSEEGESRGREKASERVREKGGGGGKEGGRGLGHVILIVPDRLAIMSVCQTGDVSGPTCAAHFTHTGTHTHTHNTHTHTQAQVHTRHTCFHVCTLVRAQLINSTFIKSYLHTGDTQTDMSEREREREINRSHEKLLTRSEKP